MEIISERGQTRPADWPKDFGPLKFAESDLSKTVRKEEWEWKHVCSVGDLMPTNAGTTCVHLPSIVQVA